MSDNVQLLPAIISNPSAEELDTISRIAKTAIVSLLLPEEYNRGTPEERLAKATVVALKGREIGIPIMQALSHIHVIKGKPALSAELMLALIYRAHPNAKIDFLELSDKRCVLKAMRPGGKACEFSFSTEDASKAGLLQNSSWTKYRRAMLRSRTVSEMARSLFPDALMGCSYTPEELGGEVSADDTDAGRIRDVSATDAPNNPSGWPTECPDYSDEPNDAQGDQWPPLPQSEDTTEPSKPAPAQQKPAPYVPKASRVGLGSTPEDLEDAKKEFVALLDVESAKIWVVPQGKFKGMKVQDIPKQDRDRIISFVDNQNNYTELWQRELAWACKTIDQTIGKNHE